MDPLTIEDVTPELRLRRVLGRIPGGEGAPVNREADLGELLACLERSVEEVNDVVGRLAASEREFFALKADIAAMRRVLGFSRAPSAAGTPTQARALASLLTEIADLVGLEVTA